MLIKDVKLKKKKKKLWNSGVKMKDSKLLTALIVARVSL